MMKYELIVAIWRKKEKKTDWFWWSSMSSMREASNDFFFSLPWYPSDLAYKVHTDKKEWAQAGDYGSKWFFVRSHRAENPSGVEIIRVGMPRTTKVHPI